MKKRIAVGYHQLFTSHEIRLNEKGHRLPYMNMEDPEIRELRDQVSDNSGATGAGMASLYWDMEILVKAFVQPSLPSFCVRIFSAVHPAGNLQVFTMW